MSHAQATTSTGINLNSLTTGLSANTITNIINQQQQQQQTQQIQPVTQSQINQQQQTSTINITQTTPVSGTTTTSTTVAKKKKKKKPPKERKPRPKPGEIQLKTALDGSTLFSCPECQMCYPESNMNLEISFVHSILKSSLSFFCRRTIGGAPNRAQFGKAIHMRCLQCSFETQRSPYTSQTKP
jgi:hypothetical protein